MGLIPKQLFSSVSHLRCLLRRHAVKVLLSPEGRRMLKALVRRKKLPQSEVIEAALIRDEYGKR